MDRINFLYVEPLLYISYRPHLMMDKSGWINAPFPHPLGGTIPRCALQIFPEILSGITLQLLMVVTLVMCLQCPPPIPCLTSQFLCQCSLESHPYTQILISGSASGEFQPKTNLSLLCEDKTICLQSKHHQSLYVRLCDRSLSIKEKGGFPGGAVVENLPANAGDTGLSLGLGRSHMPRSN